MTPQPSFIPHRSLALRWIMACLIGIIASPLIGADYSVSTTGNAIVITDDSGNSDTLAVSEPSLGTIKFAATGRTFSVDGGPLIAGDSGTILLAGITGISVNTAAGADIINVGAFISTLPSLTINGGTGDDAVNYNGDITFAADASLDVDLQNDSVTPGVDAANIAANANLITSGVGSITFRVSQSVALASGSSLETVNGGVTVEANQQAAATAGSFFGIDVNNGLIKSTGLGVVTVKGKGGNNSGGNQWGLGVRSGGKIMGGNTGTMIASGTGGASAGDLNYGIVVQGVGSSITSGGAVTSVAGLGGGSGASAQNAGVFVNNSGVITAGGSGSVIVKGTGGVTTGSNNKGVWVSLSTTAGTITSGGGHVQVTGTGGGTGASSNNQGVDIVGVGTSVSSTGGTLEITATAGANTGTQALRASGTFSTTANQPITLIADSISLSGTVNSGIGTTTLRQLTNSIAINLGGADVAGVNLGLSDIELDLVTAGTVQIGDSNSGAVTVSASITRSAATVLNLTSAANIDLSTGSLNSAGGSVTLNPGTNVFATNSGVDVTTGTTTALAFAAGTNLKIVANNTTADSGHTQLNVAGEVDLTGVNLSLSGTLAATGGQSMVIVNNDGTDAITGTFAGLVEGGIISLNGVPLVISYAGGTGNDVVLTYAPPVVARDNATVTVNEGSTASNTGTFSDLQGNSTVTLSASVGTITQNNVAGTWSWSFVTQNGPAESQTVTITANDGVTSPVSATFDLTVNNVAPTASSQSVSTNEDTAKLITLAATDPGADTLTFSIVNGPTAAQGTLSTLDGNQVTFTPAANFNGPASFTFKATDSDAADSITATVSIDVIAVNDPPSFTKGSNLTIASGLPLQTVSSWAANISAGPPDEAGQMVHFVVTNDNNLIFLVQPSIDASGTLTYQPAAASDITATVTVQLVDDGGGNDTSAAQTFTITVTGPLGSGVFDTPATFSVGPSAPKGPIARDASGTIWGTTITGGLANQGTIWKRTAGGVFSTVAELGGASTFGARRGGGLRRGFDGNFYVTTTGTTTGGVGSILRMSPDGALSAVQASTGAFTPAPTILGTDGFLYGGIQGWVVKTDPAGGSVWSLQLPAGSDFRFPLFEWLDGSFYGTTINGGTDNLGTLFKISRAGQLAVLNSFTGTNGSGPSGALITGHDGAMYGVTSAGGAAGAGTVYRFSDSGNYAVVASFPAGSGTPGNILFATDGNYYGTLSSGANGGIFKMTRSGVLSTVVTFTGTGGAAPGTVTADTVESLVWGEDGKLYGATGLGGSGNAGVIFSVTPSGVYSVLRNFASTAADPGGALVDDYLGNKYGTNRTGGTGLGSIFKITPTGDISNLHEFSGADGSLPQGGLAVASDGNFYGTTSAGGSAGLGTLFRVTPAGSVTILFSFTGTSGANRGAAPLSPLTRGPAGVLYGTTSSGGTNGVGTIFRIANLDQPTPAYSVLVDCTSIKGATPTGGMVMDADGTLFGSARAGGSLGRGSIFKIVSPESAPVLTVLKSFSGTTGAVLGNSPQSSLIKGTDGKFYGTTTRGGASDAGTLFRISSAGVFESLTQLTNTTGAAPGSVPAGLVQGPDGLIYGATFAGGTAGNGVVFALDPATLSYTVRKQFDGGSLGSQGRGTPFAGREGNIYGLSLNTMWRLTFAPQPTAKTLLATSVTSTSATLNGVVNPNGASATIRFDYGLTSSYGTTVSATLGSVSSAGDRQVSLSLTGLPPHSILHYRVVATVGGIVISGADQVVSTLNTEPFAISGTVTTDTSPVDITIDPLLDDDHDALAVDFVASPANGTVSIISSGILRYTPGPNFATAGFDQFVYRMNDGVDASELALVTLRFQPGGGATPLLPAAAVSLPTASDAYAAWLPTVFGPGDASLDQTVNGDPDGDGLSNGIENLMGLNPKQSNASTLTIELSGNPLVPKLRYSRLKGLPDNFEIIEESSDLINWNAVSQNRKQMKRSSTSNANTDSVEVNILPVPGASSPSFFRISVTLPSPGSI